MAIQDRNLAAGTKLWARYKGDIHRAEMVEVEGKLVYRLTDGREFKSPSAAGSAITGKACNGWAFWTVGEPAEGTDPTRAGKPASENSGTSIGVPKPEPKRRGRRRTEQPATAPDAEQAAIDPPGEDDERQQAVTCEVCGESFPDGPAATEHYYAVHGQPEEPSAD